MRVSDLTKIALPLALCLCLQAQAPQTPPETAPPKEPANEIKGMPPRAAPGDYQAHQLAGNVTIAAEFTQHSIATLEGTLTTEDYVVVEVGFFGPPGSHATLSADAFTLRINGKKPLPSQPYGLVVGNVKDPEWVPPESASGEKSKTSLSSGGSGAGGLNNDPPPPVHVPFELQRAMGLRVQKAALPGGDRPLPQAGLLFFRYGGQEKKIHSIELTYSGPGGKTTLTLQP
jgi:hypothetical protein